MRLQWREHGSLFGPCFSIFTSPSYCFDVPPLHLLTKDRVLLYCHVQLLKPLWLVGEMRDGLEVMNVSQNAMLCLFLFYRVSSCCKNGDSVISSRPQVLKLVISVASYELFQVELHHDLWMTISWSQCWTVFKVVEWKLCSLELPANHIHHRQVIKSRDWNWCGTRRQWKLNHSWLAFIYLFLDCDAANNMRLCWLVFISWNLTRQSAGREL